MMANTTADRCKKCFALSRPSEDTLVKSQPCDCDSPHIAPALRLSPGLFDFIFSIIDKEPT
jgi:hypothetical protein